MHLQLFLRLNRKALKDTQKSMIHPKIKYWTDDWNTVALLSLSLLISSRRGKAKEMCPLWFWAVELRCFFAKIFAPWNIVRLVLIQT